jgi:hypothetical protein
VTDQPGWDFFISFTAVNRSWAEWIAVQSGGRRLLDGAAGLGLPPGQRLPPPDAAGRHLGEPEAIVRFVGDRDRPGPGLLQPQAIMPAALATDMPTTVARVLQEKP